MLFNTATSFKVNFVIWIDCVLFVSSPFFLVKKCVTPQKHLLFFMKIHEGGDLSLIGKLTFHHVLKSTALIVIVHFRTVLTNSSDCICNYA